MSSNLFRDARAGQLRASEVCVLMGVKGYDGKIAHDLYLQLKHGIPFDPVDQFRGDDEEEFESLSDDIRRGNLYEPFALQFAGKDLGMEVDFAKDKDDGVRRFSRKHPTHSFIGAMPDCLFSDRWLGEAKCPRPHVLRKQVEEGPLPKFFWQMSCQASCYPEAPGVRFILYDCVACRVYIYEFPREFLKIKELEERCVDFYTRHIIGDEPFNQAEWDEPVSVPLFDPLKPSDYVKMEGAAWKEAARRFASAKSNSSDVEFELERARGLIADTALAAGIQKVNVDGHKFIVRYTTKKVFDGRAFKQDHPDILLSDYNKDGKPYLEVRYYPPRGRRNQ